MKLLVLGATGRTGRYVVDYALETGYAVAALVRRPEKIAARHDLSIVQGSPENVDDIAAAVAGCDAVLSALNNNRTSDLPWAKPVSPAMFMTRSICNAIAVMRAAGTQRIVVLSALGAGDSLSQAPFFTRFFIRNSNLGIVFEDHSAQEAVIARSGLDWTCVRPTILTSVRSQKRPVVSYSGTPKPRLTIGRASVARFVIDIIDKPEFFKKMPVISSG